MFPSNKSPKFGQYATSFAEKNEKSVFKFENKKRSRNASFEQISLFRFRRATGFKNKRDVKSWLRLTQARFDLERLVSINKLEPSPLLGIAQIARRGEMSLNDPKVAHKPTRPCSVML